MTDLKLLGVAAATGRVGCVLLQHEALKDWRMSREASASPEKAVTYAHKWIDRLQPDAVIVEATESAERKGEKTKRIVAAFARTARERRILVVCVERQQIFSNKYEEAASLVKKYPDLLPWLPVKRRVFDNEPYATVLFEALSLVERVKRDPAATLFAAMDYT